MIKAHEIFHGAILFFEHRRGRVIVISYNHKNYHPVLIQLQSKELIWVKQEGLLYVALTEDVLERLDDQLDWKDGFKRVDKYSIQDVITGFIYTSVHHLQMLFIASHNILITFKE